MFALIELFKNPVQILFGNSCACIAQENRNLFFFRQQLQKNRTSGIGEFHRIAEKILPYLKQQFFISDVGYGRQIQLQAQFLPVPFVFIEQDDLPQLFIQGKSGSFYSGLLVFQAGQHEDIPCHCGEPFGSCDDTGSILQTLFFRQPGTLQESGISFNGRKRCFELMGNIAREIIVDDFRTAQFLCHAVEIMGHFPDFRHGSFFLDGNPEVAVRDLFGRMIQFFDRGKYFFSDKPREQGADEYTGHSDG